MPVGLIFGSKRFQGHAVDFLAVDFSVEALLASWLERRSH